MAINDSASLLFRLKADTSDAKTQFAAFRKTAEQEVAQLEQKVIASAGRMGSSFERLAKAGGGAAAAIGLVGIAAVAATAGVLKLAESAAKFGDHLIDLKAKTNLSVETLSVLRTETEKTDVSFESISHSLVIFQKNMESAVQGNQKLRQEFKLAGVDIHGTVDQGIKNAIKTLAEYEDGVAKTKLATDLFGRSGADILVVIDQMGGDFEKAAKRAKELGLVLGDDAAKRADDFNDQVKELHQSLQGLANVLGEGLLPALTGLAKDLTDGIGKINEMTAAVGGLKGIFQALADVVRQAFRGASGRYWDIRDTLYDSPAGPATPAGFGEKKKKLTLPSEDAAGGGEKDLDIIKLRIKHQESLAKDAMRVYQDETEELKRQFAQRIIDEDEYSQQAIEQERKLLESKMAVYAAERREAEQIALPNKRAAELLKIQEKEKDAYKDYKDAISKINDEEAAREEQDAAKLAEIKKRALELDRQLFNERKQLAIENRQLAAQNALDHLKELEPYLTGDRSNFIRQQAAAEAEAEQARFAAIKERVRVELEAYQQELGAGEEYLEMKKLLDGKIAEEELVLSQKLAAIYKQRNAALERENPVSARSLFGDKFADLMKQNEGDKFATFAQAASESFAKMSEAAGNFGSIAGGAFKSFAEGLGQVVEAWVLTGETGPAALRKLTAAVLAQVAAQAAVKAIFELAEGFAMLFWNPAAAATHFTAAALYGSVAAVAGIAGRAIAPANPSSAGATSTSSAALSGPRVFTQDSSRGTGATLSGGTGAQSFSGAVAGAASTGAAAGVLNSYRNSGALNGLSGLNLTNSLLGDIAEFTRRLMLSFDRYVETTPGARKGISLIKQSLGFIGNIIGFDGGGYTGDGISSAVAGLVHRGEYVFSQRAVQNMGVSALNRLHSSAQSGTSLAGGMGANIHLKVELQDGMTAKIVEQSYRDNGRLRDLILADVR